MKYKHDPRYEHLAFPHVVGENDNPIQSIVRHPHLHAWKVRSLPPFLPSIEYNLIPVSQNA